MWWMFFARIGLAFATSALVSYLDRTDPHGSAVFYRKLVNNSSSRHFMYTMLLTSLAKALHNHFVNTNSGEYLDEAVACYHKALGLCTPDSPQYHILADQFAASVWGCFKLKGKIEDMEEAITNFRLALASCPSHDLRIMRTANLAYSLTLKHLESDRNIDKEEIINLHRKLLEMMGLPKMSSLEKGMNFCQELFRFRSFADAFVYFHHSSTLIYTSAESTVAQIRLVMESLKGLANALETEQITPTSQFAESPPPDKLAEVIPYLLARFNECPPGHPDRQNYASSLGNTYILQFGQLGNPSDLREAIRYFREAVACSHPTDSLRIPHLTNLAAALTTGSSHLGDPSDLKEVIAYYREAHYLTPEGHPERPVTTMNLVNALSTRYGNEGNIQDLYDALSYHREAVDIVPHHHPVRISVLNSVAVALGVSFGVTGNINELEESIGHLHSALSLSPSGPGRALSLQNLGCAFVTRFGYLNNMADLEEAIGHFREAIDLLPPQSPAVHSLLINLASTSETRFELLGLTESLQEAISLYRCALKMCPPDHSNRAAALDNLGSALHNRFRYFGEVALADLEESISYHREALLLYPPGHPLRSAVLESLATTLHDRYSVRQQTEDLEATMKLHREALALRPPGHPGRIMVLYNLGNASYELYSLNNELEHLTEVISFFSEAEASLPADRPMQIPIKTGLAKAYLSRSHTGLMGQDIEQAFVLYELATNHHSSISAKKFGAVLKWIEDSQKYQHKSTLRAYSRALTLLDQSLVVYPTIEAQQKFLTTVPKSLACDAAANAINLGEYEIAVELLEQGRAILWSRMSGYRQPLEILRTIDEGLANHFESLCVQLEQHATSSEFYGPRIPGSTTLSTGSVADTFEPFLRKQRIAFEEWERTLANIRSINGFGSFLEAMPFSTLKLAAAGGPVILVNISQIRSDALIILPSGCIVPVPLPKATPDAINDLSSRLHRAIDSSSQKSYKSRMISVIMVLRLLWENLVLPIKEELDEQCVVEKTQIWWCPTGQLCGLPLHAAGPHRKGQNNIPDLYISSYAPTLASLLKAREHVRSEKVQPNLLVIAPLKDETLPMVPEEIERIQRIIPSVTLCVDDDAKRLQVISALQQHPWAHFACHGARAPQPFQSSFELPNGETLSLLDLIKARLPHAELAFLSACHTAAGDHIGTPDEVIHLASALQFTGFRSVVGTLWEIYDDDAPNITESFYWHIFQQNDDGTRVLDFKDSASALNQAVNALRSGKDVTPDRWVPFIHVGA